MNENNNMGQKGIKFNLSNEALIQESLARQEGELAFNQALVVNTGKRTARSPKDRYIVRDHLTENGVDWNPINQSMNPDQFNHLWQKALSYLASKADYFLSNLQVGADERYGIGVKVMTELAWHNLFAKLLFLPTSIPHPSWTLLNVPGLTLVPALDHTFSDAAIIINFTEKKVLICGTYYAGEMKKAMFSVLNFILPDHDILPMHCAANVGEKGESALFFGLSGTGKTTLSADPKRFLIGDDEHGWGEDGIFNFEGGCYAKCIQLSEKKEPLIWQAIQKGTILENVVIDSDSKVPNYDDTTLTENTRAAYPREYIAKRIDANKGEAPKHVIFLTCDLYGVLPPVARLTLEQAAYYFLSGYTAQVGSTEVNQGQGIKPTFSTCFGAPFFPRFPKVYADLLLKRLQHSQVFLVNTGWTGGQFEQGGKRFSITFTRQIIQSILQGIFDHCATQLMDGFNLMIPKDIQGFDPRILYPKNSWQDEKAYDQTANQLIHSFRDNFKRFSVDEKILQAGPRNY